MFLCIIFNHETIPFILLDATEEECLRAIEKAKENFWFDKQSAIVESDYIFLHAWDKKTKPKQRLYCYNNSVVLETDTKCEGEKESTRELLAYERNISADEICIIEI